MRIPIKSQIETLEWLGVGALHESDNLRLCQEQPDTWQPIGEAAAPIIQQVKDKQNDR